MGRKKPLIVVSGSTKGSRSAWHLSKFLLRTHGANARFVHPGSEYKDMAMDGLLLLGGVDIDPGLYDSPGHESISRIEPKRDSMELVLLKQAEENHAAVMGICRGMQMINLYYGGTLFEHIGDMVLKRRHQRAVYPMKTIDVLSGSGLFDIVHTHRLKVNALHHQAIDALGEGLSIAAYDHNGITQCIEHREKRFVTGIQWHPEFMPYMWHTHKLFQAFVQAAAHKVQPARKV